MNDQQLKDRLRKLLPQLPDDSIDLVAKNEDLVQTLWNATSAQVISRHFFANGGTSFQIRFHLPDGQQRVFDIQ